MSSRPLTVACVLRSGGEYGVDHVARLREQVAAHMRAPYEFWLMTDRDDASDSAPVVAKLWHDWPGWWAKMHIFVLPGPVLYLDLDTTIVGDLSPLADAARTHEFIAFRDWGRRHDSRALGSGVMAWRGDVARLHDEFYGASTAYMSTYKQRGDQGFISDHQSDETKVWQDLVPGMVASYKFDIRDNSNVSADVRVIAFHGRPKPWDREVPKPWR